VHKNLREFLSKFLLNEYCENFMKNCAAISVLAETEEE
jgi:hypothetical protein